MDKTLIAPHPEGKRYQFVNVDIELISRFIGTLKRAVEIVKQIPDHCPSEPEMDSACMFCDMGGAGYSSKGDGHHDDKCIWNQSREFLKTLEGGE